MIERDEATALWNALVEKKNPLDPAPDRWGLEPEAYRGKTVYVGHYPPNAFPNRQAFQTFCWYSSSAQQAILADGPTPAALEWFVPETEFPETLLKQLQRPASSETELWSVLERVNFGDVLNWVREVTFVDAVHSFHDDLSVEGETSDGWLQLFTVDDGFE